MNEEKKPEDMFKKMTNEELAWWFIENVDELRQGLSMEPEVIRLVLKSKICQFIFKDHIYLDRAVKYLVELLEKAGRKDNAED